MAQLNLAVFSRVKNLRFKFGANAEKQKALDKLLWWSFPVVYPNWERDNKKCYSEYLATRQRRKRVNAYIREMMTLGEVYFVTLTFGESYDTTTSKTRTEYARRWLNAHCVDYYACMDIGEKGGREHFHALCVLSFSVKPDHISRNKVYYKPVDDCHEWSQGHYSIRRIASNENDVAKTLGYAFKASNYAFKASNGSIKPFHKRGVTVHAKEKWEWLPDDYAM